MTPQFPQYSSWHLVEPKVRELLSNGIEGKMREIVFYHARQPSKKLRPHLTVLSCMAANGGSVNEDGLYAAAAVELLHNASLLVDDDFDGGVQRRGVPSVQSKYGRKLAQCSAIDYFAAILNALSKTHQVVPFNESISKTIKTMSHGEMQDLLFDSLNEKQFLRLGETALLRMMEQKTASLFETACLLGAAAAHASESEKRSLQSFGSHLGMAFQITDDVLDVVGPADAGKDFLEKKKGNMVLYYAFKAFTPKQRKQFIRLFGQKTVSSKQSKQWVSIVQSTDAVRRAQSMAKKHALLAKQSLRPLKESSAKRELLQIADSLLERKL